MVVLRTISIAIFISTIITIILSSNWRLSRHFNIKFFLVCIIVLWLHIEIIARLAITSKWSTSASLTIASETWLDIWISVVCVIVIASTSYSRFLVFKSMSLRMFWPSVLVQWGWGYTVKNIFFFSVFNYFWVIVVAFTSIFASSIITTIWLLFYSFRGLSLWFLISLSWLLSIFSSSINVMFAFVLVISGWLFWRLRCLISWVILVKLILWENAVKCWDISSLFNRAKSFNLRFILLLYSHCFDFVDLM